MRIIFTLFAISLIFSSGLTSSATLPTPNLTLNTEIERQYKNALRGEEVVILTNEQEQFYALELEQRTGSPQGGLLILHDKGHSADWPFLLRQVRQTMPDMGWSTLSIDLPTPAHNAPGRLSPDDAMTELEPETQEQWQARVLERVSSGIKRLNDTNMFNIVIIGYGDGAYWASRYLSERLSPIEEVGYAVIMVDTSLDYPEIADYIGSLNIPILDLYMNDSDYSNLMAQERKSAAMRANHEDYQQIHDALRQGFYGAQDLDRTTRRIWGWLRSNAAGHEAELTEKTIY